MDIKEFAINNKLEYRIFTFDREKNKKNWETFENEFASFLGINYYSEKLSQDYFLYGGVIVLNNKENKVIMVPANWNTNAYDYLKNKLNTTPELKTLNL